jgi:hypothetical protein
VPTGQLFAAGSMLRPAGVEAARWNATSASVHTDVKSTGKAKIKKILGASKTKQILSCRGRWVCVRGGLSYFKRYHGQL